MISELTLKNYSLLKILQEAFENCTTLYQLFVAHLRKMPVFPVPGVHRGLGLFFGKIFENFQLGPGKFLFEGLNEKCARVGNRFNMLATWACKKIWGLLLPNVPN